jgi:hypothetical protein
MFLTMVRTLIVFMLHIVSCPMFYVTFKKFDFVILRSSLYWFYFVFVILDIAVLEDAFSVPNKFMVAGIDIAPETPCILKLDNRLVHHNFGVLLCTGSATHCCRFLLLRHRSLRHPVRGTEPEFAVYFLQPQPDLSTVIRCVLSTATARFIHSYSLCTSYSHSLIYPQLFAVYFLQPQPDLSTVICCVLPTATAWFIHSYLLCTSYSHSPIYPQFYLCEKSV